MGGVVFDWNGDRWFREEKANARNRPSRCHLDAAHHDRMQVDRKGLIKVRSGSLMSAGGVSLKQAESHTKPAREKQGAL